MSINTDIGTATANSYVSVASANEYINARYNAESWQSISADTSNTTYATTTKENLLKQATREIDRTYRFFGSKYNTGDIGQSNYQALEFPRGENYDANSDLYIPDEIKYATYEQALWVIERTAQRRTEESGIVDMPYIGKEAYNYMRGWIDRTIQLTGKYPWQG